MNNAPAVEGIKKNRGRTAARPQNQRYTMFSRNRAEAQQDKGKYDRIHVVKGGVADQLAELIANPPEGSIKTQITPKLAAEMLKYNTRNRPKKPGKIAQFSRQMTEGKWRYTGVPIVFSDQGRILDGQNRLMALEQSGATVEIAVIFGIEDDCFDVFDTGAPRSAGDVFSINNEKDYKAMAAISKWVMAYQKKRISQAVSFVATHGELYNFLTENPDIRDSAPIYRLFAKSQVSPQAVFAGCYVVCARKCRRDADAFFQIVAEGFGADSKKCPALVLHQRLVKAAVNQEKLSRTTVAGLTIEAWNRYRANRTGHGLKYNPEAPFPRVR